MPTKSAFASKINWTQAVAAFAMVLAMWGFNLTAEQQAAIVTTIGLASAAVTWVLRTWFTTTLTHGSVDEGERRSVARSIVWAAAFATLALWAINNARAADMPLMGARAQAPAAAAPSCTQAACTGFYVGGGLTGTGSNLDILGSGLNGSVFAGGGLMTGEVGYQFWNGTYFAGGEVFGGYNLATSNAGAISPGNNARWLTGEIFELGGALSGLFGTPVTTAAAAPSQGPLGINVPAAISQSLLSPYVAFGDVQRPWGSGWATGAGARFVLASHWELDLRYLYVNYGGGANVAPGTVQRTDNLVQLLVNYKF